MFGCCVSVHFVIYAGQGSATALRQHPSMSCLHLRGDRGHHSDPAGVLQVPHKRQHRRQLVNLHETHCALHPCQHPSSAIRVPRAPCPGTQFDGWIERQTVFLILRLTTGTREKGEASSPLAIESAPAGWRIRSSASLVARSTVSILGQSGCPGRFHRPLIKAWLVIIAAAPGGGWMWRWRRRRCAGIPLPFCRAG